MFLSLKNIGVAGILVLLSCSGNSGENIKDINKNAPYELRDGMHNVSLQWISNKHPLGQSAITKDSTNWYHITGAQQGDSTDFLLIKGRIKVIDARHLLFIGEIRYRVGALSPLECNKSGQQNFVKPKNKNYWRLQDMTHCGTTDTVDYVDIFL